MHSRPRQWAPQPAEKMAPFLDGHRIAEYQYLREKLPSIWRSMQDGHRVKSTEYSLLQWFLLLEKWPRAADDEIVYCVKKKVVILHPSWQSRMFQGRCRRTAEDVVIN